jgi:hypothetical protein
MLIPINHRKGLIPKESLTSLGIIYQAVLCAMMENCWIFIDDFGGVELRIGLIGCWLVMSGFLRSSIPGVVCTSLLTFRYLY